MRRRGPVVVARATFDALIDAVLTHPEECSIFDLIAGEPDEFLVLEVLLANLEHEWHARGARLMATHRGKSRAWWPVEYYGPPRGRR